MKHKLHIVVCLAALLLSSTLLRAGEPPKPAAPPRDPNRKWDAKHETYADLCFICDKSLREKGRLWCKEHDCYEDRCWECQPDERDANRAYCEKHKLYVDECFLCKPELKTKPAAPTENLKPKTEQPAAPPRSEAPAAPKSALFCKEHRVDEADCANCHPDMVAALEVGQGMKVRLPSMNSAAKVGIQTSAPYVGYISDAVECLAELAFNQNKLAQIAAPVAGILRSVDADLGAKVEEGALLAKLWSAAISEAVSKAVLSQQTVERERKLRAERVSSERELQEAEAAWRAAREHLIALGFDDRQIAALEQNARAVAALEIRAPFAGEIIERAAVRGTMVEAGKPIFTLTDTTTMWVTLHIPESQLNRVRVGQRVELTVDSMPDYAFGGTLTWIAAQLDERTRMIRARAEVPNSDGRLKARMFARARILTSESSGAVVVPQTAIQQYEGKSYVFIKHADDLFEARVVRLGAKQNGRVEIINGLRADEQIVVERSYAVKSEMLKSRLGAGCCE